MSNIHKKIFRKILDNEVTILSPSSGELFEIGNGFDIVISNTDAYEDICKTIFDVEDKYERTCNSITIDPDPDSELSITADLYNSLMDYFGYEVPVSIICDCYNHDPFNVIMNCINSFNMSSFNGDNGIILNEKTLSYFWYTKPVFKSYCNWINGFIIESDISMLEDHIKEEEYSMRNHLMVIK